MMPRTRLIVLLLGLLIPVSAWSANFNVRFIDNENGEFAAQGWMSPESAFQRNVHAALRLWGARIQTDEVLEVIVEAADGVRVLRAGGSGTLGYMLEQRPDGHRVWEHGALSRIRTGTNPNQAGYDLWVGFDVAFLLANYWIDPQPETRLLEAASDKTDLIWIIMHELGHAFGVDGFRSRTPDTAGYGKLRDNDMSIFDSLSRLAGSGEIADTSGTPRPLTFTGTAASALLGGPVPLFHTREDDEQFRPTNFYHLGDCESPEIVKQSLMRGCFSPLGRGQITALDVAVMADLGYTVNPIDANYADPTGVLRLPFVIVPGMGVLEVDMKLVDGAALIFELVKADAIPLGTETPAQFSFDSGKLTIPRVDVNWGQSVETFIIEMQLLPGDGQLRFQVTDAR